MRTLLVSHMLLALMVAMSVACQQNAGEPGLKTIDTLAGTPPPASPDASVESGVVRLVARNFFKEGETKVNRADISAIPNAPTIPSIYRPSTENYHVTTSAVATDVAAIIKVNAENEADFKEVRVLRLESNDIYPNGFNWQDCTVEVKDRPKPANDKVEQDYSKQFETYLPDFEKRTVTCLFDRSGDRAGQYFVVVSRTGTIPTTAFTKIKAEFAGVEKLSETGESVYILSVGNLGPKTAAEVNFHSHFDYDTDVVSTETTNGRCQRSTYGSSHGSIVCYLGALAPGEKATVRFRSKPSGDSGRPGPHKANNENWFGYGFAKESANDGYWPANSFRFGKNR